MHISQQFGLMLLFAPAVLAVAGELSFRAVRAIRRRIA